MATTTKDKPKQVIPPAPASKAAPTVERPANNTAAPTAAPAGATQQQHGATHQSSKRSKSSNAGRQKPSTSAPASGAAVKEVDPAASRHLLVILHGKRVDDELVREAISELKAQGHQVTVRVTFDRGDVDAFVAEAVRLNEQGTASYQTIVAAGGDGTLNEVVCAMMSHRDAIQRQGLAVALLPLGTANDFACVAGISVDPRVALRTALDPTTIKPIDVAAVNGRHFVNIAVAGSVASVSPDELSSKWKRLLGPVAIGFHVLKRAFTPGALEPHTNTTITFCPIPAHHSTSPLPPINAPTATPVTQGTEHSGSSSSGSGGGSNGSGKGRGSSSDASDIQWLAQVATQSLTAGLPVAAAAGRSDDSSNQNNGYGSKSDITKMLTADLLMLAAGNSRQMGRRVNVCPDALLDDGLLDFTLLTGGSMAGEAAALLSALMSGDDHAAADRGVAQVKASWLLVESPGGTIPINRDGEPEEASNRLVFEVLPKALPMHLPDDRMLVAGQEFKLKQKQLDLQPASSEEDGVISSGIRGNVFTAGEIKPAAVAESSSSTYTIAGDSTAAASTEKGGKTTQIQDEGSSTSKQLARKHRRHKKLRKRTLQRMVFEISQPEGWEVRQRQRLVAASRQLCRWGVLILLGGVVGWAARSRRERRKQQQQKQKQREAVSKGPAAGPSGGRRTRRRLQRGAVAYGM